MLLVDTNIFLEILLQQEKNLQCQKFLEQRFNEGLYISSFGLDSIGIILYRRKKIDKFEIFLQNMISKMEVLSLDITDLLTIKNIINEYKLDYDDAYQYLIAKKYNLQIVSLDKDFDKTDIKRIEP